MPIIDMFTCFESNASEITGFEIEYDIKSVLDTRFTPIRNRKTIGRGSEDDPKTI